MSDDVFGVNEMMNNADWVHDDVSTNELSCALFRPPHFYQKLGSEALVSLTA